MVFIQDPTAQALPRLYSITLDDDGSPTRDKSVKQTTRKETKRLT